nr:zinc finger MYM-type protein 1-like [Onthophagus taurus]
MKIPIEKCIGQGYDGANVMSGIYNGLQQKIKNIQQNAEYVHCASHNLNLVIKDAIEKNKDVSAFFVTLQEIYSFFGNSINRWDLLSKFTGESNVTLKKLNPTRWSGRLTSLLAVKLRYLDIIKSLTHLMLTEKKEIRDEAQNIKDRMEKFEFIFMCVFLHKILAEINLASKVLQKKNVDLDEAKTVLNQAYNKVSESRSKFTEIKGEAAEIARTWNVPLEFQKKRQPKVKHHFDELAKNYHFSSREDMFRVGIFNVVIDTISHQLHERFKSMEKLRNYFGFLDPQRLSTLKDKDILKECEKLQKKYSTFLSEQFSLQFIQVKRIAKCKRFC